MLCLLHVAGASFWCGAPPVLAPGGARLRQPPPVAVAEKPKRRAPVPPLDACRARRPVVRLVAELASEGDEGVAHVQEAA